MDSACGGHSSPPPWWRFLGVSSSSCYGGPSNICGRFAAIATSKTRYGCCCVHNQFAHVKISYIITDAHTVHIPVICLCDTGLTPCSLCKWHATKMNLSSPSASSAPTEHTSSANRGAFMMSASLECDCCPLAVFTHSHSWTKGVVCCMTDMGGMRGEQFLHFLMLQHTPKCPHSHISS